MSKEDDGGPAFPAQFWDERAIGMTLRDYFAAEALAALINIGSDGVTLGVSHPETNLNFALASYAIADAMLKARAQ